MWISTIISQTSLEGCPGEVRLHLSSNWFWLWYQFLFWNWITIKVEKTVSEEAVLAALVAKHLTEVAPSLAVEFKKKYSPAHIQLTLWRWNSLQPLSPWCALQNLCSLHLFLPLHHCCYPSSKETHRGLCNVNLEFPFPRGISHFSRKFYNEKWEPAPPFLEVSLSLFRGNVRRFSPNFT